MTESPQKKTIYARVADVMGDVQKVGKDRRVTEGPVRFNFRGIDDVVNAVGPVLRQHGVIVVPHEIIDVEHERYTTAKGTAMHGVTITIGWRFYGPDGDYIPAETTGESADSGDKAVSKAHSVAYRTVLLQALCIPTDEPDPDEQVHERGRQTPTRVPDIREPLWADIKAAREARGWSSDDVAADFTAAHDGKKLMEATADELQAYLLLLKPGEGA